MLHIQFGTHQIGKFSLMNSWSGKCVNASEHETVHSQFTNEKRSNDEPICCSHTFRAAGENAFFSALKKRLLRSAFRSEFSRVINLFTSPSLSIRSIPALRTPIASEPNSNLDKEWRKQVEFVPHCRHSTPRAVIIIIYWTCSPKPTTLLGDPTYQRNQSTTTGSSIKETGTGGNLGVSFLSAKNQFPVSLPQECFRFRHSKFKRESGQIPDWGRARS